VCVCVSVSVSVFCLYLGCVCVGLCSSEEVSRGLLELSSGCVEVETEAGCPSLLASLPAAVTAMRE